MEANSKEWADKASQNWPPELDSYLKTLMVKNKLFAFPDIDMASNAKKKMDLMCFDQWRPDGVQDKLLRQILEVKASHHRLNLAPPPRNSKSPPGISKASADQIAGAIKVWNSMGIEAQEELFRQQFRSSKNVQSLLYVWDEFIAEEKARENLKEVADIPPPKGRNLLSKDYISTKNHNTPQSWRRRTHRDPIVEKIEVLRDNDRCEVRYRSSKIRKSETFKMATKEPQETMMQQAEEEVMAEREEFLEPE